MIAKLSILLAAGFTFGHGSTVQTTCATTPQALAASPTEPFGAPDPVAPASIPDVIFGTRDLSELVMMASRIQDHENYRFILLPGGQVRMELKHDMNAQYFLQIGKDIDLEKDCPDSFTLRFNNMEDEMPVDAAKAVMGVVRAMEIEANDSKSAQKLTNLARHLVIQSIAPTARPSRESVSKMKSNSLTRSIIGSSF